jgi:redox-sensitive bicupin YhaK (pirin superfamily)
MIDGHMRHEDHLGNVGELKSGGVQWMTAGRGVIHSEMPQQQSGRMRGFQLWINLPAREKMKPAAYRDIPAAELPVAKLAGGGRLKVIAGRVPGATGVIAGPVNGTPGGMATDPLMVDLALPRGASYRLAVPRGHNAFVYAYEGSALIGGQALPPRQAGILGDGDYTDIEAADDALRLLLMAGRPLGEPVVQYGPFVMNTREEITQAQEDYRNGRLTA